MWAWKGLICCREVDRWWSRFTSATTFDFSGGSAGSGLAGHSRRLRELRRAGRAGGRGLQCQRTHTRRQLGGSISEVAGFRVRLRRGQREAGGRRGEDKVGAGAGMAAGAGGVGVVAVARAVAQGLPDVLLLKSPCAYIATYLLLCIKFEIWK